MIKRSKPTANKQPHPDLPPGLTGSSEKPIRVPLWQAIVMPLVAILIFFILLEGGLTLIGVKPALKTEDPFVGFSSNVPLFVPSPGPKGQQWMSTAPNKENNFNPQSFPMAKASGGYRIFTLGGSTTYGRPYDDNTSFAGWLRELLPMADQNKNWEVINAGGISYASYRVAHLMEELVNYQPDLFIIYTGHNEFLEERTYSQIKEIPPVIRSTVSLLAKTRTWSAMNSALQRMGIKPQAEKAGRDKLAVTVDAILDQSAGLDRYNRDDKLRENILQHYRISLERMVALARSVDAQVILVTPASSLNDCSPFKSEHTQGLEPAARQHSAQMLAQAKKAISEENWQAAVDLLQEACVQDPRHAELQYRRGQALLALGRFEEAEAALRMARDEDVSPLRALTPMRQIVIDIAREQDVTLVDYVDLLEQRMQETKDYPIPGKEFFLDHVHPTIEGHKILAIALVQSMIEQGLLSSGANLSEQSINEVTAKVESRIDTEAHGQALANLARVLIWAGKLEDAARLARQAQETAGEYRQVAVDSASILASVYALQGKPESAVKLLYSTIEKTPGAIELRLKLAQNLIDRPFLQLEEAGANLLLVCQQLPNFDDPYALFGIAMAKRGRLGIAYDSLTEALRLNPNNSRARTTLAQILPSLGAQPPKPRPPNIMLEIYPSRAPHKLAQVSRNTNGSTVFHGIEVEFHENGRLKRFLDLDHGKPNGLEMNWNQEGRLLSRVIYRQGIPVKGGPNNKGV
jgi:Flp pilus assembly protein TadD